MSARARIVVAALAAFLASAFLAPAASRADVPIYAFDALPSTAEAGMHPDIATTFVVDNRQSGDPSPCSCNDAKDVITHLPAGLIGNPHATPQCDIAQFSADQCPVDSQVGVAEVVLATFPGNPDALGGATAALSPVFNLVPSPSQPGLLAFKFPLADSPVFLNIGARTQSDYGLDVDVTNINHIAPLHYTKVIVWGVPASPVHDKLRFSFGEESIGEPFGANELLCQEDGSGATADPSTAQRVCPHSAFNPEGSVALAGPVPSQSPEEPFTQNPTTCGLTSLATTLDVLAYDGGETQAESPWPATTGCERLTFNPSLFARPTTEEADSPSGIDVDLKAPLFESPDVPSPSEIRSTVVTLPEGFTINPGAADGKSACTEEEAKFGTKEEAKCPEDAKLGTLEVHSPVLPGVLPGAVYIGKPLPGERYRLFITFDGFGVHVKLPGTVHPDPRTGQIVTEFRNLPQFPFEDFDLHFFGAERGVLATPSQCGTYPVTTEFEPWDAAIPNKTSTQYFTIDSGPNGTPCPSSPRPFNPSFKAAGTANTAGSHTDFWIDLTREDGEQNLSALDVTTPPGFAATLAGVPYCPESDIAAASAPGYSGLAETEHPSCPASSQVGEAIAGAGPGTHPFYAPGRVYLAGPYKGAPLSLVVITPAVEGPYDLGNVVVRTALDVNPETAQVTAVSDPLPQILEGVPLRLRSVLVDLNRPNFALNPTDCDPFSVTAKVAGTEGALASASSPFQVANCASLPFAPQLSLSLAGKTKRGATPALKAELTMKGGEANIARAQVTLPHTEFLDQAHIRNICTRAEYSAGAGGGSQCRAGSVYGRAIAYSPLLEKPLEGPVFLRSSSHELPDLVASLGGQIHIDLDGHVESAAGGRIRNTFEVVPDAPVSRFVLEMQGGDKGLLENAPPGSAKTICAGTHRASALFTGQNGKVYESHPTLTASCRKPKRHKLGHRARISAAGALRGGGEGR